jgi:NDP-sugar pyrophosphorylase family protein
MTTAIITMAGFGRRFLDAGYKVPKYRIVVHERSLFSWAMLSLAQFIEAGTDFVFVARAADEAETFIREQAAALSVGSTAIVELDAPTDGQATTALAARSAIRDIDAPIVIYNIDTFVHPLALSPKDVRGQGWIPCFRAAGDGWSFADADSTGLVRQVREKVRISPHATIGLYWFSSFRRYEELYRRRYSPSAALDAGERYVAPIYNELIADGEAVYIQDLPLSAVIPLGVPAEVEGFAKANPPDLSRKPEFP